MDGANRTEPARDALYDALCEELRFLGRVQQMRAGQIILAAGAESREVYLVLSGRVHVTLFAASGREVSIRDIGQGDIFGELAAIDGGSRAATVIAATDGSLAVVPADAFLQAATGSPDAALPMLRRLARQVRTLTDKIFELSALPARGRLHCELLRLAGTAVRSGEDIIIEPAPTHAELAARIGSQREVVTREFSYLAELDIVRQDRRRLTFTNLTGLVRELRRSSGETERVDAARAPN